MEIDLNSFHHNVKERKFHLFEKHGNNVKVYDLLEGSTDLKNETIIMTLEIEREDKAPIVFLQDRNLLVQANNDMICVYSYQIKSKPAFQFPFKGKILDMRMDPDG